MAAGLAGYCELPDELAALWEKAGRLREARTVLYPSALDAARTKLLTEIDKAAGAGKDLPDGREGLARAAGIDAANTERAGLADRAAMRAEAEFCAAVVDQAATIISGVLRRAHGEV